MRLGGVDCMWAGKLRPAAEGGYIQAQATWRTKSISPHREKKTGVEGPVRMGPGAYQPVVSRVKQ